MLFFKMTVIDFPRAPLNQKCDVESTILSC